MSPLEADARAREYRDLRASEFAVTLGGFALLYALGRLFVLGPTGAPELSLFILGGALFWGVALRMLPERARAPGLVLALSSAALLAVWAHGVAVVGGPLLVTVPLSVTVLLGPRLGALSLILVAFAFSTLSLASPTGAGGAVLTAVVFLAMVMSSGVLLRSVLEDTDHVFEEFDEAKASLETAGRLRMAAEEARDQALAIRNEARSVEALGVVAGTVVHDLNNMAQVIRAWADEMAGEGRPLVSRDAAQNIIGACNRVTNLASDVLMLGQQDSDAIAQARVSEALPLAARALRRAVRETIRIVVDPTLGAGEEPLPVGSADLIHIILETAAIMNIGAIRSGTLILSAPLASEVDGPEPRSGMRRHPFLLALELRRDGKTHSVRAWHRSSEVPSEGREILTTAEVRVLFWCPTRDSACISFDLFPSLSATSSPSRLLALAPATV